MKIFGIILFIFAAFLLSAEAKNAKWGVKGRRDVLLHTKDVIKVCEQEGGCVETVVFPVEGDINEKVITFIYASDELGESSDVQVALTEGGFGQKTATVTLTAKQGEAISFVIEIYGRQFAFMNV